MSQVADSITSALKICTKCKLAKLTSEFSRDKSRKDGLKCWCKDCDYEVAKKRYRTNPGRYKKLIGNHADRLRMVKQAAKSNGCSICGYKRCASALEFHHKESAKKESTISQIDSFKKLKEELAKCIVVCANCHREIHEKLIDISTRRYSRSKGNPQNGKDQKNILFQIYR